MIALVHNILPPYRVSLFNAISQQLGGELEVLLVRDNHPTRRAWSVPWDDVDFRYEFLRGVSLDTRSVNLDWSFGVARALDRLEPTAVVLAGWNLNASWAALRWCRTHDVPAIAWVESWSDSGVSRGAITTAIRRRFLGSCAAGLVAGHHAEAFVRELSPDLPTTIFHNSVDIPRLRALGDPDPEGSVLFLGELSERKGADVVLAARTALLQRFPRLAFAGTGPMLPEVEAAARNDPAIEVLGFVDGPDLVDVVASAQVVVLPSRRDPWPLVSIEALVAGRPLVLGPGVGSAPDLTARSEAVAVMGSMSPDELVRGCDAVAGQRVDAEVRDSFRPEHSAQAFVQCVTAAVEHHTGRR